MLGHYEKTTYMCQIAKEVKIHNWASCKTLWLPNSIPFKVMEGEEEWGGGTLQEISLISLLGSKDPRMPSDVVKDRKRRINLQSELQPSPIL